MRCIFALAAAILVLGQAGAGSAKNIDRNSQFIGDSSDVMYQKKLDEYLATVPKAIAEEARMTVPQLIHHKGYPVEVHKVVTIDGYVLEMHRIPRKKQDLKYKGVAFLQHGIFCSSADWLITGPGNALGYVLADEGYDVWLGNARGNTYSRNNTYMTPNMDKFWDFSWHEIGTFDLPAMIDYVLEQTGEKSLFYAGHSQGTTTFYVMCSQKPEYNRKIRAQFSLAPIAYMKHMYSPFIRAMALGKDGLSFSGHAIGMHEVPGNIGLLGDISNTFCSDEAITQVICSNLLFAISGYSPRQMNATVLPVMFAHTPAGASLKQLMHYAQEITTTGDSYFGQFDYGLIENLRRYGQWTPREYNLGKITAPVYMFYSENDWLASAEDVTKLYLNLDNANDRYLVPDKNFNHLDFMYGIEARAYVYDKMVSIMKRY